MRKLVIFSTVILLLPIMYHLPFSLAKNICRTDLKLQFENVGDGGKTVDWPMFRGNIMRNGTSESNIPSSNNLLWKFKTEDIIQSSAVVAGNLVYFGSDDAKIRCLVLENGLEVWNYTTENSVLSTPCIYGDRLFVGATDYKLYCLNRSTGSEIWNFTTTGQVISSPLVLNNIVYFGSQDGTIYALSDTKKVIWSNKTPGEVWSSFSSDGSNLYIGSGDRVYCIHAPTGAELWNFTVGTTSSTGVLSTPAFYEGCVFFGSEDKNVYCLNASTGTKVWSFASAGYVYSSPAVYNHTVYIGSEAGYLYAIPTSDPNSDGTISQSELKWAFWVGNKVESSPAASDGKVVFGTDSRKVYCIDAESGTEIWNYATGKEIYSSPSLATGLVLIGSLDTYLYCFGKPTEPTLYIDIQIKSKLLKSEEAINVQFNVSDGTKPIDGAFLHVSATQGTLSANTGTVPCNGTFTVMYTAPKVISTTTVTISATASKFGYLEGARSIMLTVENPSQNSADTGGLLLQRHMVPIFITLFILLDILLLVIILRKRRRMRGINYRETKPLKVRK